MTETQRKILELLKEYGRETEGLRASNPQLNAIQTGRALIDTICEMEEMGLLEGFVFPLRLHITPKGQRALN